MSKQTKNVATRKYRSSHTCFNTTGETNSMPSETIPDQQPSMRELLHRHINGITDNVSMQTSFSGDLPDLRGVEPHELRTLIDNQREAVRELEEKQQAYAVQIRNEKYKAKKERDNALLKEIEERFKTQK